MELTLSEKKCPVCNMAINKEKAIERDGKHFCSEDHAEQYQAKLSKEQSKPSGGGSCCH